MYLNSIIIITFDVESIITNHIYNIQIHKCWFECNEQVQNFNRGCQICCFNFSQYNLKHVDAYFDINAAPKIYIF